MNIAAGVVTYNRLENLKLALEHFQEQISYPDCVIVVNNGSTDETETYLTEWENKAEDHYQRVVINSEQNEGGSGGFYRGLQKALDMGAEWIWVSDDDAYPASDAFHLLKEYLKTYTESDIAAVCSSVLSKEGKTISFDHRRTVQRTFLQIKERYIPESEYTKNSFEFDVYSFVGTVFNGEKLKKAGLPIKEYFIWFDDSEHSFRMKKEGKIICVPSIKVIHDLEYSLQAGYQWKDYYLIRNRIDAIRRDFPKRYYLVISAKKIMDIILVWVKKDKTWARLFTSAVVDAWRGKLGVHKTYKPGWKPAAEEKVEK